MKLIDIFNTFIPEAIQNDPVFKDSLKVFIEVLDETSSITNDLETYFEANNAVLTDELIKVFLENLEYGIKQLTTNKDVINRIRDQYGFYGLNLPDTILPDNISKFINREHIIISKELKQKKGKQSALRYFYNFIRQLNLEGTYSYQNIDDDLVVNEVAPFQFSVEGSLFKDIYNVAVKPIAHPLGFAYSYMQMLKIYLQEYYSYNIIYNVSELKVYCPYLNSSDDYSSKKVIDISINYLSEGYQQKEVYFDTGEYIILNYDRNITVYNADTSVQKDYGVLCVLSLQYTTELESSFVDELHIDEVFSSCDYYNAKRYPLYGEGNNRSVKYGECNILYGTPPLTIPIYGVGNYDNIVYAQQNMAYGRHSITIPGELEIQDELSIVLDKPLIYKNHNLYYGEYNLVYSKFTKEEKFSIDLTY